MLSKRSIRLRLTLLCAILLTVCCVGLTLVLNFSAFRLADQIDATMITTPATDSFSALSSGQGAQKGQALVPSQETQSAKRLFSVQSAIYMIMIIIGGSALTYYISDRALKPLEKLNAQVKGLSANNLSQTLEVPPGQDEISQLTQSFNQMVDKLNQAFMVQKRFAASAAHELRTPLAVLQTKVDVFNKKSAHTKEEYQALIYVFENQISKLRGLVGNLLDMTNMQDDVEQGDICVGDMFEEIFCDLHQMAKDKRVELTLACEQCTIFGNVELLYRAFYNLVENAIKYNVEGGTVQVKVQTKAPEKIQIWIKDSGIGIADESKPHVFEPFYRVDKSRSRAMGGAGLGLALVDSMIKKHGGTTSVLDNENGGTCFVVELPLRVTPIL